LDCIAFDADDTLWQNESLYKDAQRKLEGLLSAYPGADGIAEKLLDKELQNIHVYGYGIKSFALSMIETAVEMTRGEISGDDVLKIINIAREMLRSEVLLLAHVEDVIPALAQLHPLMIITKGDLLDQESKLERSGIRAYFSSVEVVSEKRKETYEKFLRNHQIEPERFMMVGNSLKSDILPVAAMGGHAVYIPHRETWIHEQVDEMLLVNADYYELDHIGQLPTLIARIEGEQ
jgi:putative hydrolase of the HAD superfamily